MRSAVLAAAVVLVAVLVFAAMKWVDARERDRAAGRDVTTMRADESNPAAPHGG